MRFRLYYEGPLFATQRDPRDGETKRMAPHKQAIRRNFHRQLKQLWSVNKFLSEYRRSPRGDVAAKSPAKPNVVDYRADEKLPLKDVLAEEYKKFNYRFVPLVRDEDSIFCSLDILFLRRDGPGNVISAGDIDNRIKTIIDALRAPKSPNELVGDDIRPGPDEDPFFCLLWDDNQVHRLTVETDTLLEPQTETDTSQNKVRLVITVELRSYNA